MDTKVNEATLGKKEYKKRLPLFVKVYETIYNRLVKGFYPPGKQLPSESDLAEELKVSRGTLRQALLLLQEDGLIINRQGKGSFVLERSLQLSNGIERLNNPLLVYANVSIDQINMELQFQVATDKHREQFQLKPSSLIAMMENIYYSEGIPTGLSQIFIPYEVLSDNQVQLGDNDEVYQFYNDFIGQEKLYGDSTIRIAYARKTTAAMLHTKEDVPMIMMEEKIYQANKMVIFQKYFMLPAFYELKLQRYNDRRFGY